jgi:cobalamin biosynthesis Mg chelatase CobN
MAKENTPERPVVATPKAAQPKSSSKKSANRGNRTQVGGTAVPGAKSTAPKPPPAASNPSQQQAESYNRDMRRRMQHMGTGPYSENQRATPQDQRKKRIERRKQRLEEERERLRRSSPTGKITLGRRNLYFIIGVAVLIVLLIVIFAILRATHVIA